MVAATDAAAQGFRWPENPENLQVLPDSIRGARLGGVMRGFAIGLGVRCSHCHVGEGPDLTTYDFPKDEKEAKRIARVMIEMVEHINASHLTPVDTLREASTLRVEVTCVTCHRGVSRPRMIEDILAEQIEVGGVPAADSTYRVLRDEYYGGFSYDFRPGPLSGLAEELAAGGQVDEAVAVLELEAEFNPDSYSTYFTLATIQARAGRTEEAVTNMEKALELAPDRFRGFLQGQLDQLKARSEDRE